MSSDSVSYPTLMAHLCASGNHGLASLIAPIPGDKLIVSTALLNTRLRNIVYSQQDAIRANIPPHQPFVISPGHPNSGFILSTELLNARLRTTTNGNHISLIDDNGNHRSPIDDNDQQTTEESD